MKDIIPVLFGIVVCGFVGIGVYILVENPHTIHSNSQPITHQILSSNEQLKNIAYGNGDPKIMDIPQEDMMLIAKFDGYKPDQLVSQHCFVDKGYRNDANFACYGVVSMAERYNACMVKYEFYDILNEIEKRIACNQEART